MKRILSCILLAAFLFSSAFPVQGAALTETDDETCTCSCHLFYSVRDDLLQKIADRTIDGRTLLRVLCYFVQLYVWRVLGIHQYGDCGIWHY